MTDYEVSPEMKERTMKIAEKHYPRLVEAELDVECVFIERKNPAKYIAKIQKVSDLWRTLLNNPNAQYIILFDVENWGELNPTQEDAVIHHELGHCALERKIKKDGEETLTWKMRKHEIGEFFATLDAFGIWNADLLEARDKLNNLQVVDGAEEIESGEG